MFTIKNAAATSPHKQLAMKSAAKMILSDVRKAMTLVIDAMGSIALRLLRGVAELAILLAGFIYWAKLGYGLLFSRRRKRSPNYAVIIELSFLAICCYLFRNIFPALPDTNEMHALKVITVYAACFTTIAVTLIGLASRPLDDTMPIRLGRRSFQLKLHRLYWIQAGCTGCLLLVVCLCYICTVNALPVQPASI
jgi:hypothetical protein